MFCKWFFSGANDNFLAGLATQIEAKKGLINDPLCSAAHQNAYDVGVRLSRTGQVENQNDAKILTYAMDFKKQVYEVILSKINF